MKAPSLIGRSHTRFQCACVCGQCACAYACGRQCCPYLLSDKLSETLIGLQVRSAQWSGYGFLGGAAVGVAFASPPTTKLLGAANGALVGYLIGTVESAAVPQDWIGRASTGAPKKAESKEEKAAEK